MKIMMKQIYPNIDKVNEFYDDDESSVDDYNWQDRIIEIVKKISPEKFEKLCQKSTQRTWIY